MKSRSRLIMIVAATALTIGGCDQVKKIAGGGKPTGQVVATVDGDEITVLDLRQEMGAFSSRDPAIMKAAQQQALQQIIAKRAVAAKAKDDKLDKSPEYAVQLKRAQEGLLIQAYQRKIATSVAAPTRAESDSYVVSHPEKFADRKVMIVDQLIVAPNKLPPERFRALNTLEEVRSVLQAEGVPYQGNVATIDSLTVDGRLLTQLAKLPPGEVFILPQQGSLVFNRILETRSLPFVGDPATAFAMQAVRREKAEQAVRRQLEFVTKSAEKSIVYNAAYKPAPTKPKPPAPPAAAPPTSAAPAMPAGQPPAK